MTYAQAYDVAQFLRRLLDDANVNERKFYDDVSINRQDIADEAKSLEAVIDFLEEWCR